MPLNPAARTSDSAMNDRAHCHAPIHPPTPVPTPLAIPAVVGNSRRVSNGEDRGLPVVRVSDPTVPYLSAQLHSRIARKDQRRIGKRHDRGPACGARR